MTSKLGSRRRLVALAAAATAAVAALTGCGSSADGSSDGGGAINLVAYSTPQTAFGSIEAAFKKTSEGKGVSFKESYGPSGDQSRAVAGGQPADFVNFSLESDVTRLVDEGLVASDWNAGEHQGIVADSVVVIAVRKGNPKHITGWDDIVKPGVGIVTPNPASSGGARWNTLAAYGHVIADGGSEADAEAYLTKFFKNAVALPGSARDALTSFTNGNGDVLISYENEAILARQKGTDLDYIVPDQTLLIETPAAVTKKAPKVATDWLNFLFTKEAQTDFAKSGYRPVIDGIQTDVEGANDPSNPFPAPAKLLTVAKDFGGWPAAQKKFFDDGGIVPKIQASTGKTQ
ncbi:MAG: sulfate ABC transporter substrate-binding protein [Nocardioidaceae bacterium]|nr:sulfate ABC transporter substrate-binding protein [Nocardioidaceae bacterium]